MEYAMHEIGGDFRGVFPPMLLFDCYVFAGFRVINVPNIPAIRLRFCDTKISSLALTLSLYDNAEDVFSSSNLRGDKDGKELLTISPKLALYPIRVIFKSSLSLFHIKICNSFI